MTTSGAATPFADEMKSFRLTTRPACARRQGGPGRVRSARSAVRAGTGAEVRP
jgi:hypothetical protein